MPVTTCPTENVSPSLGYGVSVPCHSRAEDVGSGPVAVRRFERGNIGALVRSLAGVATPG